jgi:hypothetical protein
LQLQLTAVAAEDPDPGKGCIETSNHSLSAVLQDASQIYSVGQCKPNFFSESGEASPFRHGCLQRFLGPLALGDIDYGAHKLNKIAGWAQNRVPYSVDISDFAAGMNDPVVHLELCPFPPCSLQFFRKYGLIIRMKTLNDGFEWRHAKLESTSARIAGPVPPYQAVSAMANKKSGNSTPWKLWLARKSADSKAIATATTARP